MALLLLLELVLVLVLVLGTIAGVNGEDGSSMGTLSVSDFETEDIALATISRALRMSSRCSEHEACDSCVNSRYGGCAWHFLEARCVSALRVMGFGFDSDNLLGEVEAKERIECIGCAFDEGMCSPSPIPHSWTSRPPVGNYALRVQYPIHGMRVPARLPFMVAARATGSLAEQHLQKTKESVHFEVRIAGPNGWSYVSMREFGNITSVTLPMIGPHFIVVYMCDRSAPSCSDSNPQKLETLVEVGAVVDRYPMWWFESGAFSSDEHHPGFPAKAWQSKLMEQKFNREDFAARSRVIFGARTYLLGHFGDQNEKGSRMKIPRIIHQIWTGGWDDLRRLENDESLRGHNNRRHFLRWTDTWKSLHPSHEHVLWNTSSMRDLVVSDFPSFLPVYDGFGQNIKRIDAARYFILLKYGGLMLDIDFEALRPTDDLLLNVDIVLGAEKDYCGAKCIQDEFTTTATGFMASVSHHPLWWMAINQVAWRSEGCKKHNQLLGVVRHTGPNMLEDTARFYYQELYIGASTTMSIYRKEMYPCGSGGDDSHADKACVAANNCTLVYPNAHAVHHYTASWYDEYMLQLDAEYAKLKSSSRLAAQSKGKVKGCDDDLCAAA